MHRNSGSITVVAWMLVGAMASTPLPARAEDEAPSPPEADVLTIEEAFTLALQHSPQLGVAEAQVAQARAGRLRSYAVLHPQVSLGATYTLYDEAVSLDFGQLYSATGATALLYGSLIARGQLTDPECALAAPLLLGEQGGAGISTCGDLLSGLMELQEEFEEGGSEDLSTQAWIFPKHQIQLGLNASLALTPRAPFLIRAASRQVDAAEAQRTQARQDLLFGVYQAYLGAVRTEDLVAIQSQAVETARAHLQTTRTRFDLGQVPRPLVLRAEVAAIQAERDLESARKLRAEVRRGLALAMGVESVDGTVAQPAELLVPDEEVDALVARALDRRPDLAAVRSGIEAARGMKGDAIAQFLPAFNVVFQYGRQWAWARDEEADAWIDAAGGLAGKSDQWTLAVQAQVPIWDGGTRISQVQEAESRLRQARLQEEQLRQLVRKQVSDASETLRVSRAQIEAASRQVELAKENLRLTEARYQLGQEGQLGVLDARLAHEQALLALLNETLDRDLARATLLKAAGLFESSVVR